MSRIIELDVRPDAATLRQFGWIALGGFSLLALFAWKEWLVFSFGLGGARQLVVGTLLALGALSGIFSATHPPANRPIYLGLAVVAFPIGLVLSYLILGALFYLLIAPFGLVFRGLGRDLMGRRYAREADTYWVDARPARPPASYFRQF
jgi:hypothetical protein